MRPALGGIAVFLLAACASTGPGAVAQSSPSNAAATPSAAASATAGSSQSPSPAATDIRLVIEDIANAEVRLTRLDATRTATVKGQFDGIVGGKVIVLNGRTLQSVSRSGAVTRLGTLAGTPSWLGPGTVLLKPDLTEWVYTITDSETWTSRIHLGSIGGDHLIATIPSPDGNAFYQPFAWKSSGIYFVREPTGIGGAGPFLDYHFSLGTFSISGGAVSMISPDCAAYGVLDDGTILCGRTSPGDLEVRLPSAQTRKIHLTRATSGNGYDATAYIRVLVSPDARRVIVARNGAQDPIMNYQMAVADLTASSATAFGPLDYVPDTWLPDGRVVATHQCVEFEGAGPCDAGLDGTYIFSADGKSSSLFFKMRQGSAVVGYI